MNSISKLTGLSALFLFGMFAIHNSAALYAVIVVQDCTCGTATCDGNCEIQRRAGCRKCGAKRGVRKCPKCQVECCQLEVKMVESKETCFKTEQKIVCIPRVRFPWQKCCPPNKSKTRTVNVLKTHSFKCPSCEYEWSLVEPEIPESEVDSSQAGVEGPPINENDLLPYAPAATVVPAAVLPPPTASYDPSVPVGSGRQPNHR